MPLAYCKIANTLKDLSDHARVRDQGLRKEEGLIPEAKFNTRYEIDSSDLSKYAIHLTAYVGDEPAAALRLLLENPYLASRNGYRLGLPLERWCRIIRGPGSGVKAAELSRLCILRKFRNHRHIIPLLIHALHAESHRQGITHYVGLSNAHTDSQEDADLAYQVALSRGRVSLYWRIEPRVLSAPEAPPSRRWYGSRHRQLAQHGQYDRLHLPPTLSLVTKRVNARIAGPPIYEPHFQRYGLPIVVEASSLEPVLSSSSE